MIHEALPGEPLHVVGIAGSLRRGSYNRALLCAAAQLVPPALRIEIEELDDLPMFNADLDDKSPPEAVGPAAPGRRAQPMVSCW